MRAAHCIVPAAFYALSWLESASSPTDIVLDVTIVWRIKRIKTVLRCIVYYNCAQYYKHTQLYEQFL